MQDALIDIEWNAPNLFRLATLLSMAWLLLEQAMLLSHYWHRIIPLRRTNPNLLAPPIVWTFALHLWTASLILLIAIGVGSRLVFNDRATFTTYAMPIAAVVGIVIISQFVKYYSKALNRAEHDRLR
jgi:hypothetical protein